MLPVHGGCGRFGELFFLFSHLFDLLEFSLFFVDFDGVGVYGSWDVGSGEVGVYWFGVGWCHGVFGFDFFVVSGVEPV